MKISILIVIKKWDPKIHFFEEIKKLIDDNVDFEVLLAEGNNPSFQRNLLAKKAEGDFILFLDNDSLPEDALLERYNNTWLAHPSSEVIGGPSLLKGKDNLLFKLSTMFFSSSYGVGPVRCRYNSVGNIRRASEKDLILCNLLMKRDFFLKTKGFKLELYPGEENELLKRLQTYDCTLYDPMAIVYRCPRNTFFQFLLQLFSYGNGRAKHFQLKGTLEYLFLIPMFFTLYILSLPFLFQKSMYSLIPLLIHLSLTFILLSPKIKNYAMIELTLLLPIFFFCGHFSYGMGMLFGLLKFKILKYVNEVNSTELVTQVYKLKSFKKNYTY
jgi:GT2 family glycosyltransferase